MVDPLHEDPMPCQPPTLTELAEARAGAVLARQIDREWLMASDDPPDVGGLLAQLVNRPAWHALANCRGAGPDLFFPERGTHRPVEALTYCEGCTVRSQCLASALEVASTTGVWGGTTGRVRRGLRRGVA
jgi:WhiB family transcriptional regulator, redox-sensing transcriptional regulator